MKLIEIESYMYVFVCMYVWHKLQRAATIRVLSKGSTAATGSPTVCNCHYLVIWHTYIYTYIRTESQPIGWRENQFATIKCAPATEAGAEAETETAQTKAMLKCCQLL